MSLGIVPRLPRTIYASTWQHQLSESSDHVWGVAILVEDSRTIEPAQGKSGDPPQREIIWEGTNEDGSSRLCSNYRRFEEATCKDGYLLPSFDVVLLTFW